MTVVLSASFRNQYRGGFSVECQFVHPLDRFSITALFGPSGGGKTTILRCLAGLERPEEGRIACGDEIWFDAEHRVCRSPQQREIGYLFQEYALFPHLSVARNILYGLRLTSRARQRERLQTLLDRFGLRGLEARYPSQISGGQQQRVALARAVARQPRLLLLDEPLSALDAVLRDQVRGELREQLVATATPTILVTHDRNEVLAFADQVVIVAEGRVLQAGIPREVFARPARAAAARIVGFDTIAPVRVTRTYSHDPSMVRVCLGAAEFDGVMMSDQRVDVGAKLIACVRAEDVRIESNAVGIESNTTHGDSSAMALVRDVVPEIGGARVILDVGCRLSAMVTHSQGRSLQQGEAVRVVIPNLALQLHAADS